MKENKLSLFYFVSSSSILGVRGFWTFTEILGDSLTTYLCYHTAAKKYKYKTEKLDKETRLHVHEDDTKMLRNNNQMTYHTTNVERDSDDVEHTGGPLISVPRAVMGRIPDGKRVRDKRRRHEGNSLHIT